MTPLVRILALVSLVALLGCGGAETPSAGASSGGESSASSSAERQPFLWEVRDGENVSYLFGTIHVGFDLGTALPERHRHALDSARTVALEADTTTVDAQAAVAASRLPPDRSLDALLPEDVYAALASRLAPQIPEEALRRFRPWFVSVLVEMMRIREERPDAPSTSMDAAIGSDAAAHGASMLYLETMGQQLAMINEVPEPYFVEALTELVRDPTESDRVTVGTLEAYARGDASAMESILFDEESLREYPEAYELLFYRRNRAWVATLEPRMREGGVFVAVGLGHLLGDAGLVASLASRGFVVTRLD